jgi:hypothetical protein
MSHQQGLLRSKSLARVTADFRDVSRRPVAQTFFQPDPIDPRNVIPYRPVMVMLPAPVARRRLPALIAPARWNLRGTKSFLARTLPDLAVGVALAVGPAAVFIACHYFDWALPVILIVGATALAGAATKQLKEVLVWGAVVAGLAVVALSLDTVLRILDGLNILLRDWTTYRALAGATLMFLAICFLDREGFFKQNAPAQPPASGDPRGYGRYAIADFVEEGTYGDADLAAKQSLHMAISRQDNKDLRFTPKFRE